MSVIQLMGIVNMTPDSFFAPSRATASDFISRVERMAEEGASIIDIGAVSTRPGAPDVSLEEEWARLSPVLEMLASPQKRYGMEISVDTYRAEIVRRCYETIGSFIVNDISAGEDDEQMLPLVGSLSLPYIAMHKRGNPRTMDAMNNYTDVVSDLMTYFKDFASKAEQYGIKDWILDPGLGFAKNHEQCWEILERLREFKSLGYKILIGAADKRFTAGDNAKAHRMAARNGADILRVHDVAATRDSISNL